MFRAFFVGAVTMAVAVATGAQAVATKDGCDPIAGAKVFQQCAACHSVASGALSRIGPNLNGVVGRKAGSLPGYQYSNAMKLSGLTWTKANLDAFLAAPSAKVPGTKMPFAGLSKAQDRSNVIAYLLTAKK